MKLERRDFLRTAGMATAASLLPAFISCGESSSEGKEPVITEPAVAGTDSWEHIRGNFVLDREYIHMAGLLLASHPRPVRDAISTYRKNLDVNPVNYVNENFSDLPAQVRKAAANYMGVQTHEIALTDSTTMGTALLINGIEIREDQEMLSAEYDYSSTHRSIEFKSQRTGTSSRRVPIYRDVRSATKGEIVDRLTSEIKSNTRLLTGTWVHSSTGLKIPVRQIADRVAEINAGRAPEDQVLFFVDGVHGFGVEDTNISDLGCDFFSAGTHKWMFAPRGTGILWGNSRVHNQVTPTIPTFTNGAGWGGRMSPGGFKPFEHQWAMEQAFRFHSEIGKEKVQDRIHSFASQIKQGLEEMGHVQLYTPLDEELSSGIVCFDIDGMSPHTVVNRLAEKNIIASTTPYDPTYARLTPGIFNTDEDIENTLRAVKELG